MQTTDEYGSQDIEQSLSELQTDFIPFDPVSKRTEATIHTGDESYQVLMRAAQVLLDMADLPDNEVVVIDLKKGVPYEVILMEAKNRGADLIVMDKLGKRGVGRILLGSIAERVIEFTKVSVMLARE